MKRLKKLILTMAVIGFAVSSHVDAMKRKADGAQRKNRAANVNRQDGSLHGRRRRQRPAQDNAIRAERQSRSNVNIGQIPSVAQALTESEKFKEIERLAKAAMNDLLDDVRNLRQQLVAIIPARPAAPVAPVAPIVPVAPVVPVNANNDDDAPLTAAEANGNAALPGGNNDPMVLVADDMDAPEIVPFSDFSPREDQAGSSIQKKSDANVNYANTDDDVDLVVSNVSTTGTSQIDQHAGQSLQARNNGLSVMLQRASIFFNNLEWLTVSNWKELYSASIFSRVHENKQAEEKILAHKFSVSTRIMFNFIKFNDNLENRLRLFAFLDLNAPKETNSYIEEIGEDEVKKLVSSIEPDLLSSYYMTKTVSVNPVLTLTSSNSTSSTSSTSSSSAFSGQNFKHAGIKNIGNTCFMNAALQVLLNIRPLNDLLDQNASHGDALTTALIQLKNSLLNGNQAVDPMAFVVAAKDFGIATIANNRSLPSHTQQDAAEFLVQCLDGLSQANLGSINNIFQFTEQSMTSIQDDCKICGTKNGIVSNANNLYTSLTLPINQQDLTLSGAFRDYSKVENLQDYHCENCAKNFGDAKIIEIQKSNPTLSREAILKNNVFRKQFDDAKAKASRIGKTKQLKLLTAPQVLTIVLKRFDSLGNKISTPMTFPLSDLDISQLLTEGMPQSKYDLIGFICHNGNSLNSGHYISYIKDYRNGNWFRCDDSTVENVELKTIVDATRDVSSTPYVLFYQRKVNDNLGQYIANVIQNVSTTKATPTATTTLPATTTASTTLPATTTASSSSSSSSSSSFANGFNVSAFNSSGVSTTNSQGIRKNVPRPSKVFRLGNLNIIETGDRKPLQIIDLCGDKPSQQTLPVNSIDSSFAFTGYGYDMPDSHSHSSDDDDDIDMDDVIAPDTDGGIDTDADETFNLNNHIDWVYPNKRQKVAKDRFISTRIGLEEGKNCWIMETFDNKSGEKTTRYFEKETKRNKDGKDETGFIINLDIIYKDKAFRLVNKTNNSEEFYVFPLDDAYLHQKDEVINRQMKFVMFSNARSVAFFDCDPAVSSDKKQPLAVYYADELELNRNIFYKCLNNKYVCNFLKVSGLAGSFVTSKSITCALPIYSEAQALLFLPNLGIYYGGAKLLYNAGTVALKYFFRPEFKFFKKVTERVYGAQAVDFSEDEKARKSGYNISTNQ